MHRDFWQGEKHLIEPKRASRQGPFANIDSDTALILSIILLLQKENSDPMLTMALLYILT